MKYRIVEVTDTFGKNYYKVQQKLIFIWVDILDEWDLDTKKFDYLVNAEEFVENLKRGTIEKIVKVYDLNMV